MMRQITNLFPVSPDSLSSIRKNLMKKEPETVPQSFHSGKTLAFTQLDKENIIDLTDDDEIALLEVNLSKLKQKRERTKILDDFVEDNHLEWKEMAEYANKKNKINNKNQ